MNREDLINALDYCELTGTFKWKKCNKFHSEKNGTLAGCVLTSKGKSYLKIKFHSKRYSAHRLAWFITYGYFPKIMDHINGNSLDNRIANLRECTHMQNNQNHTRIVNGSGLHVGVRSTKNGHFQARITAAKKVHHLGTFETEEDAATAYNVARKELHDAPASILKELII